MLGRVKKIFGLEEPLSPAPTVAPDVGLVKKARGPRVNKGCYVAAKQIEVTFPERIDQFVSSVYRMYITPEAQQENAIDDLEYHTAKYFSGEDMMPDYFENGTYGQFNCLLEGQSASLSGPAEYRPGTETSFSQTSFLEVTMSYNQLVSESVESLGDLPGQVAVDDDSRADIAGAVTDKETGATGRSYERRIDSRLAVALENELEYV
ncbi:uncharacterized protein [Branchiostoma lanceolatum]|uniref:uncharacterized protein isoform X2 n=1 Tax=Branchiostoma lanceolatum TaxID=7740 RepID=UPI00345697F4